MFIGITAKRLPTSNLVGRQSPRKQDQQEVQRYNMEAQHLQ